MAIGALAAGCAASATVTAEDAAVRDIAPADRSCTGQVGPSTLEDIDPATGCPGTVRVAHTVTRVDTCERIEPRCTIDPGCRFDAVLEVRGGAGCTTVLRPRFVACRCEFGVVECPGQSDPFGPWPGCVGNNYVCNPCRQ